VGAGADCGSNAAGFVSAAVERVMSATQVDQPAVCGNALHTGGYQLGKTGRMRMPIDLCNDPSALQLQQIVWDLANELHKYLCRRS
jgi:hypothetical protein